MYSSVYFLWITKVTFTSNPQNIEAITVTKDLDILVSRKKEVNMEIMSVTTKFFNSKFFM